MVKRQLTNLGNSKALVLDPFVLEYLGLENSGEVILRIENDSLILTNPSASNGLIEGEQSASIQSQYEKSQYIKDFFRDGRLRVGDVLIYYPAVEEGKATAGDDTIIATLTRNAVGNRYYITSNKDGKEYSLSGLRRKIIDDLQLTSVSRDWVYNLNNEWRVLKSNTPLSQL